MFPHHRGGGGDPRDVLKPAGGDQFHDALSVIFFFDQIHQRGGDHMGKVADTRRHVIVLGGTAVGLAILITEWVLAILGITANAIAMNNKIVKGISMAFYVIMGWLILVAFVPLMQSIPLSSFLLLLFGGLAYTFGIIFYAFGKRVKYFHSVWHLFDIAGTVLQFASILLLLV